MPTGAYLPRRFGEYRTSRQILQTWDEMEPNPIEKQSAEIPFARS
jgi:hypothetical protein